MLCLRPTFDHFWSQQPILTAKIASQNAPFEAFFVFIEGVF